MGDSRRQVAFAEFIVRHYGKRVRTILAVADGKGELSRNLASKGYRVWGIEARARWHGRSMSGVQYVKGRFMAETPIHADLVVAMHPDGAASEVIAAATRQRKPFAVVPCCIKGRHAKGVTTYHGWLNRLKAMAGLGCLEAVLRMRGRNVVLYKQ